MKTNYKNYATRTEAIRQMEVGDTILIVPYSEGEYAREQASLKSCAVRMGRKVELKQVMMVVEDEVPQYFIRVTRTN